MTLRALIFNVFGTLVDCCGGVARDMRTAFGNTVDADAFADSRRLRGL